MDLGVMVTISSGRMVMTRQYKAINPAWHEHSKNCVATRV